MKRVHFSNKGVPNFQQGRLKAPLPPVNGTEHSRSQRVCNNLPTCIHPLHTPLLKPPFSNLPFQLLVHDAHHQVLDLHTKRGQYLTAQCVR